MVITGLAALLSGCAGVNWERAFYDGMRHTADQCRVADHPQAPRCATLPSYDRYEAERTGGGGAGAAAR